MLALLGDSVTTDHISPAGSIKRDGPAGAYLQEQGVAPKDFNSYGSRRGNHEVMMRGTFANIRLRNQLGARAPKAASRATCRRIGRADVDLRRGHALRRGGRRALVVLAGKEYGSGSSRDWAAKGTKLLGVRAVIAQSFERIHRSNLIGMGVLPLQFPDGESAQSLGLTGEEVFSIDGPRRGDGRWRRRTARGLGARRARRRRAGRFDARVRIDTPREAEYFRHGGILQYVLLTAAAHDGRCAAPRGPGPRPAGPARPARRARAVGL